jgi:hypothetical protein
MKKVAQLMVSDPIRMKCHVDGSPWYSQTEMLKRIREGDSRAEAHAFIQKNPGFSYCRDPKKLKKHLRWIDHIFRRIKP